MAGIFDSFPSEPFPDNVDFFGVANSIAQSNTQSVNSAIGAIIDRPRIGKFVREVITWKTPNLGYVQMYINPQNMVIQSSKVVNSTRTKGGFIFQYGGENMDTIIIDGTTGSAGMEGINILQSIYRAEQLSFEGIAAALEQQLANVQLDSLIRAENPFQAVNIFQIANTAINGLNSPRPTLASLASNIDMFFQGVLYRGYFESFNVTENANRPGWIEYQLTFKSYAKQGLRRNFVPWHRQPNQPAGPNANPLSFQSFEEQLPIVNPPVTVAQDANTSSGSPVPRFSNADEVKTDHRFVKNSVGTDGGNLSGTDLRTVSQQERRNR